MTKLTIILLPLTTLLLSAAALPTLLRRQNGGVENLLAECSDALDAYALPLPEGSTLIVPANQLIVSAALGVGVQNYTCDGTKFVSAGAVASLYDVSCSLDDDTFDSLTQDALQASTSDDGDLDGFFEEVGLEQTLLANHFFETNPVSNSGILPVFDFRTGPLASDPNGYIIGFKVSNAPSPNDPTTDVDLLQLSNSDFTSPVSSGDAAQTVYRLQTAGGQPPLTCTNKGDAVSVPYAATYWFLK